MTTERSTGDGATTAERYGATTNALPAAGAEALPATDALHLDGFDRDDLAEWLETMILIREFETACDPLALAGKVIGGIHSSAGQEAVAVGAMRALLPEDKVAGSHRSHHHALARGLPPSGVMAELYGRATGVSEGRGGSMHLRDWGLGYAGGNGIVGAGVGLAMGLALAAKLQDQDHVAVGFVGDGGMNTGRTWEFVNLGVVWRLPLIVVCENNLYAVETPSTRLTGGPSIVERAAGFGIHAVVVDGQDVTAVYRSVSEARRRALGGDGPTFIEARTYRYEGHSTGQPTNYRTPAELDEWKRSRDPIARLAEAMRASGLLTGAQQAAIETRVAERVAEAIAVAEAAPLPTPDDAAADVTGMDLHIRGNA
jgi:pyruvate dehydrogenase E1 component alpha subunit